ncbi:MAG: BBP7 family outer membrane beta-barrel protein [Gemmataceae bacterium]|nr:BBP7 family outer membrane beta-barrel protein [Gemmataceae bacterium]
MKALIGNGLVVALGLWAAQSSAQEIRWRPVSAAPATSKAPVSLSAPVPLVRAKPDMQDEPKALPVGPTLTQSEEPALPPLPTVQAGQDKQQPEFVPSVPSKANSSPGPVTDAVVGGDCTDRGCRLFPLFNRPIFPLFPCLWGRDDCTDFVQECCEERPRIWFSASYLLWSLPNQAIPPLVTSSPLGTVVDLANQVNNQSGVVGLPTTTILFENDNQQSGFHAGGRFHFGFWFPRGNWGLEFDYFALAERNESFTYGGGANGQVHRPLIDAVTGNETTQLVDVPGIVNGTVTVDTFTKMWGIEFNARHKIRCGQCYWLDGIIGYRHITLDEGITISENLSIPVAGVGNVANSVRDAFGTQNSFNGLQVGLVGERRVWRRWFLGGSAKVAVGDMHQIVNISGSQVIAPPAPAAAEAFNTGILAAHSNVGKHQHDRFAFVPEIGLKFGFDINDRWRIWAGYDALYLSNVVRPGDQIDRTLNIAQVPDIGNPGVTNAVPARPAVLFRTRDLWVHGLNIGMEYRY